MKYMQPLLAVTNLATTIRFYKEVLDLDVESDFGANVTLTGGISLQTLPSWAGFLGKPEEDIHFQNNAGELYFEEADMDAFLERLQARTDIRYVHPVVEHRWGQRVVRFYDPDGHIIEVGEEIVQVVHRFINSGMTPEETAVRMDVPVDYILSCLQE